MLVLGLTGGIACGKSTVSRRLRERPGVVVVDADMLAREVVDTGTPGHQEVVKVFQDRVPGLVKADGSLDRTKLGSYVFSNSKALEELNAITHPLIHRAIIRESARAYAKGAAVCVLDVPLLFEAGLDRWCAATLCVVCDPEIQLQRLKERDPQLSDEDARARIEANGRGKPRDRRADYLIDNSGTVSELHAQIDRVMSELQPSTARVLLERFPPFGALSAAASLAVKGWRGATSSANNTTGSK